MKQKVNVGAVSYLNTKPLLHGITRSAIMQEMELTLNYPALLAKQLQERVIDLALLPVAAIPHISAARIVSDYGICAEGNVVSVALFSRVPLEEIESVFLDYQSRTSVRLAQLLFQHHWRKEVIFHPAHEQFMDDIHGRSAGVIIGDRALQQLDNFEYVYDLSSAWKDFTGLDFVFAAWVANKDLDQDFIDHFNQANAAGLQDLETVIAANYFPWYDLHVYYTENIKYRLNEAKLAGLNKFLSLI